jgi:hypothetical protein
VISNEFIMYLPLEEEHIPVAVRDSGISSARWPASAAILAIRDGSSENQMNALRVQREKRFDSTLNSLNKGPRTAVLERRFLLILEMDGQRFARFFESLKYFR